jgi:hypothetical protein
MPFTSDGESVVVVTVGVRPDMTLPPLVSVVVTVVVVWYWAFSPFTSEHVALI